MNASGLVGRRKDITRQGAEGSEREFRLLGRGKDQAGSSFEASSKTYVCFQGSRTEQCRSRCCHSVCPDKS